MLCARGLRDMLDEFLAVPPDPAPIGSIRQIRPEERKELAATFSYLRGRRNQLFGNDIGLFGEPAWDIMLHLYVNHDAVPVSISAVCAAAGARPTTGQRWVNGLVERGLVTRSMKPGDRRIQVLKLTHRAVELMDEILQDGLTHIFGKLQIPAQDIDRRR